MAAAKKTVPTAEQVADAFQTIADFFRAGGSLPGGDSTPAGDVETLDEDEVRALPLLELRALAAELELDEQKVKKGILDEMAAKGYFGESEDEDDEDEDDTSEEDEDGEEEEVDLESMSLKELRDLAKEEGHPRASWIKADKDALIELLSEEEEDEDDEEDEEEDGEEETEELDEDTIRAMSLAEVKKLAAELKVKISPTIAKNRKKIADKILDEMAEEE